MDIDGPEGADRFVADLRADAAIDARRRERWLRRRLAEASTIPGAVAGATGRTVRLHLEGGSVVAGELLDGAEDLATVDTPAGTAWVVVSAVVALEVRGPVPAAGPAPVGRSLAEVLTDLVDERRPVRLGLRTGAVVEGELQAVGEVAVLATAGGRTAYASLDAVAWASAP